MQRAAAKIVDEPLVNCRDRRPLFWLCHDDEMPGLAIQAGRRLRCLLTTEQVLLADLAFLLPPSGQRE